MSKSRDKQRLTPSADEKHDDRGHSDPARSTHREVDTSQRITGQFDPDPVFQFRWIPWVLTFLVILCLLLAAWVWFEILHT